MEFWLKILLVLCLLLCMYLIASYLDVYLMKVVTVDKFDGMTTRSKFDVELSQAATISMFALIQLSVVGLLVNRKVYDEEG